MITTQLTIFKVRTSFEVNMAVSPCWHAPVPTSHLDGVLRKHCFPRLPFGNVSDPFAGLPLQCLELVGKLGSPYQSHQMQLHCYWAGSSTSIIPCHWKSGQFHTARKRCSIPGRFYGQFLLTLDPLQRGGLQGKTDAVYDKAIVY